MSVPRRAVVVGETMDIREVWPDSDPFRFLPPYLVPCQDPPFCSEISLPHRAIQSPSSEARRLRDCGYLACVTWTLVCLVGVAFLRCPCGIILSLRYDSMNPSNVPTFHFLALQTTNASALHRSRHCHNAWPPCYIVSHPVIAESLSLGAPPDRCLLPLLFSRQMSAVCAPFSPHNVF